MNCTGQFRRAEPPVILQIHRGNDQGLQGPGNSEGKQSRTPTGAFPQPQWLCFAHPSGKEHIQRRGARKLNINGSDPLLSFCMFYYCTVLVLRWPDLEVVEAPNHSPLTFFLPLQFSVFMSWNSHFFALIWPSHQTTLEFTVITTPMARLEKVNKTNIFPKRSHFMLWVTCTQQCLESSPNFSCVVSFAAKEESVRHTAWDWIPLKVVTGAFCKQMCLFITRLTTRAKMVNHFEEEKKGGGSGFRSPNTTATAGQTPQWGLSCRTRHCAKYCYCDKSFKHCLRQSRRWQRRSMKAKIINRKEEDYYLGTFLICPRLGKF